MPDSIAYVKNFTTMLDRVYQDEAMSGCLTSLHRMQRAGCNAKEIMIPESATCPRADNGAEQGEDVGADRHRERNQASGGCGHAVSAVGDGGGCSVSERA
ncbi:MAG: hypothetical protein IKG22_09130 [Atopobiaceae bacterium]|nr:hypothetical protein [Atopobiaceae bacterium]